MLNFLKLNLCVTLDISLYILLMLFCVFLSCEHHNHPHHKQHHHHHPHPRLLICCNALGGEQLTVKVSSGWDGVGSDEAGGERLCGHDDCEDDGDDYGEDYDFLRLASWQKPKTAELLFQCFTSIYHSTYLIRRTTSTMHQSGFHMVTILYLFNFPILMFTPDFFWPRVRILAKPLFHSCENTQTRRCCLCFFQACCANLLPLHAQVLFFSSCCKNWQIMNT